MDKEKSILLKLTEKQFKELAHAKVESGEKSWESFFVWLKPRALTQREYEVIKMALEEQIDNAESCEGIDGTNPVRNELEESKQILENIKSRYEVEKNASKKV